MWAYFRVKLIVLLVSGSAKTNFSTRDPHHSQQKWQQQLSHEKKLALLSIESWLVTIGILKLIILAYVNPYISG